jgi:hypothetical protein
LVEQVSGDDLLLRLIAEWPLASGDRSEIGDCENAVVLLAPKIGSNCSECQCAIEIVDPEKPTKPL